MKNNATNSTNMKLSNRLLLLNIIRKMPVSRAALARLTGLTRAGVTLIVDELLKDNTLIEIGTAETDFGRKPVILDLNPQSFFVIGICITRNGCFISISNIKAEPLLKQEVILDPSLNVKKCMETIIRKIKKMISESALPEEKFLGIGITTPGPVDIYEGTILNPPNFDKWHNVNIVQEFKKHFKIHIYLENFSSSLALVEKNYGRGAEFGNFLLLVVDEGIGGGIIIHDRLYRGVGGFGNEVGHTTVDLNGRQCNCGNIGCLEVYASIPSVLEEVRSYNENVMTWKDVVDRAEMDNVFCRNAIEKEGRYLSAGIVNVLNILELEAVILTGDINYKPNLLLEFIRNNVDRCSMTRNIHKIHIMNSSITENIEIKSVAAVIIEKFFKGEIEI